jgi:hypothetical protein
VAKKADKMQKDKLVELLKASQIRMSPPASLILLWIRC